MVFDLRGIEESSGSIRALKEVQGNGIPKAQEIDNVDEDDEEEERERERDLFILFVNADCRSRKIQKESRGDGHCEFRSRCIPISRVLGKGI